MEQKIIPCVDGDDAFVADRLNAITDAKIAFEDAIEDELVVFKVTDSDGSIIAGCNLIVNCWRVADLDILWVEESYRRQGIGSALIRRAEGAARVQHRKTSLSGRNVYFSSPESYVRVFDGADLQSEGARAEGVSL